MAPNLNPMGKYAIIAIVCVWEGGELAPVMMEYMDEWMNDWMNVPILLTFVIEAYRILHFHINNIIYIYIKLDYAWVHFIPS